LAFDTTSARVISLGFFRRQPAMAARGWVKTRWASSSPGESSSSRPGWSMVKMRRRASSSLRPSARRAARMFEAMPVPA
jgi:hypothetical protein